MQNKLGEEEIQDSSGCISIIYSHAVNIHTHTDNLIKNFETLTVNSLKLVKFLKHKIMQSEMYPGIYTRTQHILNNSTQHSLYLDNSKTEATQ